MYKLWKNWFKQLHWTRKWFPVFVLIRPLVDNFFWLKEISPLLSPLTIVGVLTPLLCIISFYNHKMPGKIRNSVDSLMNSYGAVVMVNCVVVLVYHFSIDFLGEAIKFVTPTFLFLYARRFIQSKDDLIFILYTFLLSCSIPLAIFGYELVFGPIRPTYLSEGRGGGSRIRGQYGDIMSYAVYITGAFMIFTYLYIDGIYSKWWAGKKKITSANMFIVFVICLAGLVSIKHVSSWTVFLFLCGVMFVFNSKRSKGMVGTIFFLVLLLPIFGPILYESQIKPLINKEINVVNGDAEVNRAFNGRVDRWENYFAIWNDLPLYSHFVGISFTGEEKSPIMLSGGMHSDYVRNLFLGGFFGLSVFLLFFLVTFNRNSRFKIPERYLIVSSVGIFVLYSISTLPTLYLPMLNYLLPVYAFAFLPKSRAYPGTAQPRAQQPFPAV
ncbi:MAG TPA: hypothetical protein PKK99_09420 [Bacteroidia bacterium]|nr:hypothetical protein [Bacteroidia bacterium]HNP99263.1 hypothetical protein [Bacteroidia bacterium]